MKSLVSIVKLSLAGIAVLSVISVDVQAENLSTKSILPFVSYDKNQDGLVSKSEFYNVNDERSSAKDTKGMPLMHTPDGPDFSKYDTDKDGELNEGEFLKSCQHCHKGR